MEKNESLDTASSWKKDEPALKEVVKKLNTYFGTTANATGLAYLTQFDAEFALIQAQLYLSTRTKVARIRTDAELWMKNIYGSKWMQAEDYLTKIISYTTYIYTL